MLIHLQSLHLHTSRPEALQPALLIAILQIEGALKVGLLVQAIPTLGQLAQHCLEGELRVHQRTQQARLHSAQQQPEGGGACASQQCCHQATGLLVSCHDVAISVAAQRAHVPAQRFTPERSVRRATVLLNGPSTPSKSGRLRLFATVVSVMTSSMRL